MLIFSCNKIVDPTPTPQATAPNTTPTFAGSDAVFAAVSSLTYTSTVVGEYAVDVDVAVAALYDGTNAYFPMGTVGVNSNNLDMSDNNTYTSVATTGTPVIDLGFDDSSNNSWVISGSSNLPAFNFTTSRAMPTNIKFSAEVEKVSIANSFTISIDQAASNCDSVLYVLAAENKTVQKTVASNITSVTFSSAEMVGLSGTGVAQVVAYNYDISVQGGKNVYFVNEVVITDFVKFE